MLSGSYLEFHKALKEILPKGRIYTDTLRTLAYGTDASVYRLTPKIVADVENEAEVSALLRLAGRLKIPVTFRAAGTSLSGQAITDSVLVRLSRGWEGFRVSPEAERISLRPGIIGSRANHILAPFGRKIGPDPASIDSCKIGGIVANNASGMCCGVADNSYKTLVSSRLILADGTLLDTGDARSRLEFSRSHEEILDGLADLRRQILADSALAERISKKFRIKNTTGYSINALVDFEDPFEMLQRLMVGSEGTLGFIAEVTYRTVEEPPHKASGLLLFPTVSEACAAAAALRESPVSAVELMDRASLRSVEGQHGLPPGLKDLAGDVCSLLVETRAATQAKLKSDIKAITKALAKQPLLRPPYFTANPAEYEALWRIRKGILPSVGAMRPAGTSLVIEDFAVPLENLAEAALALQGLFDEHGYALAPIFGHALDGNLHFVFTQDFNNPAELARYAAFMRDLCAMITSRYDGSLKAEHGTGRNIAPFVELEWGAAAKSIMLRVKKLLDPLNILNPGVILNQDPEIHLKNIKPLPLAHELIDKCTECGFCESVCPSRGLTLTPRQRITAWREIAGRGRNGLEKSYAYAGKATCAADGLCALRCPAGINTGAFIKDLRKNAAGGAATGTAFFIARHFGGACRAASGLLDGVDGLSRALGQSVLENGSRLLRLASLDILPAWNRAMPKGGEPLPHPPDPKEGNPMVVYLPSCISRNMGPGPEHLDRRGEPQAMISLLLKAGYDVVIPDKVESLCCGMAFASKGLTGAARMKRDELESALMAASEGGKIPVLSETSPCLLHMKETLSKSLRFYEPVEFTLEHLAERLKFRVLPKNVAVHATCSIRKMGLADKLADLARRCAREVVVPEGVDCCGFAGDKGFTHPELNSSALQSLRLQVSRCEAGYSTSRTCQIGLSLHSGIPYYSIVFLLDEASSPGSGN